MSLVKAAGLAFAYDKALEALEQVTRLRLVDDPHDVRRRRRVRLPWRSRPPVNTLRGSPVGSAHTLPTPCPQTSVRAGDKP